MKTSDFFTRMPCIVRMNECYSEAGRSTPTKNNLIQLAKVLGVEPEDLTDEARSVS